MEELQALPILVQAGAVGISFMLIGLLYWLIKSVKDLFGNHITQNTAAQMDLKVLMQKLIDVIEVHTDVVKTFDRKLNGK